MICSVQLACNPLAIEGRQPSDVIAKVDVGSRRSPTKLDLELMLSPFAGEIQWDKSEEYAYHDSRGRMAASRG